jgi:hypothetical protein
MKPRVGQLHLGFHPEDLRDAEACGLFRGVAQQRRLADARLTPNDENAATAIPRIVQKRFERLALSSAAQ